MNTVVWCTIKVAMICMGVNVSCIVETASKGKVLSENNEVYLVDFSEYAKQQKYLGDYSHRFVHKEACVKDEK